MRLNLKQWFLTAAILLLLFMLVPPLWKKVERFETGSDYRIPYELSKDYWLYERRLQQIVHANKIILLGDSVVWGEYVLPDGTMSHFLNQQTGQPERFVNAGVNGLFPLALEGLERYYGKPLKGEKILLHCNLLWMTSRKADLSTDKEEPFNHSRLVPQFSPRIPCYRAGANERLNAIVERNIPLLQWVNHLQDNYFGQKSILKWTLQEGEQEPPHFPNVYKNPLARINFCVLAPSDQDPQRGPASARHKPWSESGKGETHFDWVDLDSSLQWQAFQKLVLLLRGRGNDLFVLVGPFNEHIMTEQNRAVFHQLRAGVTNWLAKEKVPTLMPDALPSALYADASHPLTQGYQLLAENLYRAAEFSKWIESGPVNSNH